MRRTPFARKPQGASGQTFAGKSSTAGNKRKEGMNLTGLHGKQKRRGLEEMDRTSLVRLLDAEISFFVRAAPAAYSEFPGFVQCFTCGSWKPWKELDCGHYIPRHHWGTRFDLRNVRPQCTVCNSYHEGEHWTFRKNLVEELGEEEVQAMETQAILWGGTKHDKQWLLENIKSWRERNRKIRSEMK